MRPVLSNNSFAISRTTTLAMASVQFRAVEIVPMRYGRTASKAAAKGFAEEALYNRYYQHFK